MSVATVIAMAKAQGISISESLVRVVRGSEGQKPKASAPRKTPAASKKAPAVAKAPASKPATPSKSDFIRQQPATMSARDIIAAGKKAGLIFTDSLVYLVRGKQGGKAAPKKPEAKRTPAKKAPASKGASPSKSEFIRNLPLTLSAKEVVAQGKAAGSSSTTTTSTRSGGRPRRRAGGEDRREEDLPEEDAAKKTTSKASSKIATAPKSKMSKADFVRQHPSLSANEIAAKAKAEGMKLDANHVYTVRSYDQRAAAKKKGAKKLGAASTPVVTKTGHSAKTAPAISKPAASNGTSGSATSVEDLLCGRCRARAREGDGDPGGGAGEGASRDGGDEEADPLMRDVQEQP